MAAPLSPGPWICSPVTRTFCEKATWISSSCEWTTTEREYRNGGGRVGQSRLVAVALEKCLWVDALLGQQTAAVRVILRLVQTKALFWADVLH